MKKGKSMKKGLVLGALCLSLVATACSMDKGAQKEDKTSTGGETVTTTEQAMKETVESTSYEHIYDDVLNHYYEIIRVLDENYEANDGEVGVLEVAFPCGRDSALKEIGYTIQDISGDGVPELVVGSCRGKEDDYYGSEIFALYTLSEQKPVLTLDGWARNRYKLMDKGEFYYCGSGGAAYTMFGIAVLSKDGQKLEWTDYYYTKERGNDMSDIGIFYNISGEWGDKNSVDVTDREEAIWKLMEYWDSTEGVLNFIPFEDYEYTGDMVFPQTESVGLSVAWGEKTLANLNNYIEFTACDSPMTDIVFLPDDQITDFKFMTLSMDSVDENGNVKFSTKQLSEYKELTKDCPLVVHLTFYGDSPYYGCSYMDENGQERKFAVLVSGMDGELVLDEIQ